MAWEKPGMIQSFVANADLSAKQFYFVKLVAGTKVDVCAAATDKPIGILQNKPLSGQRAEVCLYGISKLVAGGIQAVGDAIGTKSDGTGVTYAAGTDTTKYLVGQGLVVTASGDIGEVAFSCLAPARGA